MSEAQRIVIGAIGGSGFYSIDGARVKAEHAVETPFGKPSAPVVEMDIEGRSVFFLARHGRGHFISPSEINYRANIYALKSLGVNTVLAVNAVGIMREEISPGDMIVPDQLFDRTTGERKSTFFDQGVVGHVSLADPFCKNMADTIVKAVRAEGSVKVHPVGTLVVIEGPMYSTRAESNFYRKTLDPVAIGMTTLPEAKLAREAEMCYAVLAMATDYDCWHEVEEDVSAGAVLEVMKKNAKTSNNVLKCIVRTLADTAECKCFTAAKGAITTDAKCLAEPALRERLSLLYGKYF
jgi:5'-methylthioadenosine phosphorylase